MKNLIKVFMEDYRSEGFTRDEFVLAGIASVVFTLICAAV